jgi:hypothetical protein
MESLQSVDDLANKFWAIDARSYLIERRDDAQRLKGGTSPGGRGANV